VQSTSGINAWSVIKRSTANTGGTPTTITPVALDSTNSAATASVKNYTANPTAGTLVGAIWSGQINSPAIATSGIGEIGRLLDFGDLFRQPIILRGVADVAAWNFGGAALPTGLSIICFAEWTEESWPLLQIVSWTAFC
jgi:hypothetical protein